MIVVKLELWPGGDESQAQDLGTAEIWNTSQLADISSYNVRLRKGARHSPENAGKTYKTGRVDRFPRKDRRFGPWELLALALEATVGDRIRRLKEAVKNEGSS